MQKKLDSSLNTEHQNRDEAIAALDNQLNYVRYLRTFLQQSRQQYATYDALDTQENQTNSNPNPIPKKQ